MFLSAFIEIVLYAIPCTINTSVAVHKSYIFGSISLLHNDICVIVIFLLAQSIILFLKTTRGHLVSRCGTERPALLAPRLVGPRMSMANRCSTWQGLELLNIYRYTSPKVCRSSSILAKRGDSVLIIVIALQQRLKLPTVLRPYFILVNSIYTCLA